jgi:hypothetical protein
MEVPPHQLRRSQTHSRNADLDVPSDVRLLGVKRTWRGLVTLSANDPKQTFPNRPEERSKPSHLTAFFP